MGHDKIHPVLLCGGSGTRLWPLSRESYPKQFVAFDGVESLFQKAALRFHHASFAAPIVVTTNAFRFIVVQQLQSIGVDPGAVILEPTPRNTAPAVLAGALQAARTNPKSLVLIAPSDHLIPDADAFRDTVARGMARAQQGDIVTFGIEPTRAETGYGYLEVKQAQSKDITDLVRFVEKPDKAQAETMIADGRHLWNAGVFLARADILIAAFERLAPDISSAVKRATERAQIDLGFLRLDAQEWERTPSISVDYAIMEKAQNLAVAPFSADWSDLGSWEGVWNAGTPNAAGVVAQGPATPIDCSNTLLRSESDDLHVVGLGLSDMIVVAMQDAVLVADRTRVQDVKIALEDLKTQGVAQATELARDYRPWGWFETLSLGPRYRVKKIVVYPGASLSLQSHVHRAEHWIVVAGTAKASIGEDTNLLSENQSIYVPLGSAHRLENPGKVDLQLIEVQTGSYLGEDDIVRHEDMYRRDAAE